jgi:vesicular inhibitory amino acid transporter
MVFTWLHLHRTVLIPETDSTPLYPTRPGTPDSDMSDKYDPAQCAASCDPDSSLFSLHTKQRHVREERRKAFLRPCIRIALACLAIAGGLVFPSFEALMSLLGSGFACITLIIVPVWAGAAVFGWKRCDVTAIVLATLIGVFGTVASFWPEAAASASAA